MNVDAILSVGHSQLRLEGYADYDRQVRHGTTTHSISYTHTYCYLYENLVIASDAPLTPFTIEEENY